MTDTEYLWDHWKFNADQRLKAFNFFVVFSVFANGGLFSAIEKCVHPMVIFTVGLFISLLSVVFWMLDKRSRSLLLLSVEGLKDFEMKTVSPNARLFHLDANAGPVVRYTTAFRLLFVAQLLLGIAVMTHSAISTSPSFKAKFELPILAPCKA